MLKNPVHILFFCSSVLLFIRKKVVILLTDGEHNTGTAPTTRRTMQKREMWLYGLYLITTALKMEEEEENSKYRKFEFNAAGIRPDSTWLPAGIRPDSTWLLIEYWILRGNGINFIIHYVR